MKFQKGSALWRGVIAAAVGFVVMLCLMLAVGLQFSLPYLLAGPFYGFGFAFANWHVVMQKTKQGAIQGAAVFGIGLVLSHWLKDRRFGMWGWLYFLLRVSWHLGFCWIPGIWYGIQAILEERQSAAPAPVPASPAQSSPPASPPPSAGVPSQPSLICMAGVFSGASFPVPPGEVLSLGSDPISCQIVLPPACAASRHCSVVYNPGRRCWQVKDLSGGQTFLNGIQPVSSGGFQELPRGTVLCIGQGKNSQRFRMQ